MNNLDIYESLRTVPAEALRQIEAGRLKGKSDINPMWRIKAVTEKFGPCGIGWTYVIDKQWLEPTETGEVCAFCNISLFVKVGETWSAAIPGTGGSMLVEQERAGKHTSDECYKMALTDALSVAFKALGVAGDVYWQKDPTKYTNPCRPEPEVPPERTAQRYVSEELANRIIKGLSFLCGSKLSDQQAMLREICGMTDVFKLPPEVGENVLRELLARASAQ